MTWRVDNEGALAPWGKTMSVLTQGGVSQEATARRLIQAELDAGSRVRTERTFSANVETLDWTPLVGVTAGDWIHIKTSEGFEAVRVFQVTLRGDGSTVTVALTLNDRFEDAQVRTAKRLKGITGGASGDAGTSTLPNPSSVKIKPAAVEGLLAQSEGYWKGAQALSLVRASFAAVTSDVHGNPVMIDHYEVTVAGRTVSSKDTVDIVVDGLAPAHEVAVTAVAVSSDGHKSAPTSVKVTTVYPDARLDPPTRLTVTVNTGIVSMCWDGKLQADGGAPYTPPAHFDHIRVEESSDQRSWVAIDSMDGISVLDRQDMLGVTLFYRAIAVDRIGNESDPSPISSIVVVNLLGEKIQEALDEAAAVQEYAQQQGAEASIRLGEAEARISDLHETQLPAIETAAAQASQKAAEALRQADAAQADVDTAIAEVEQLSSSLAGLSASSTAYGQQMSQLRSDLAENKTQLQLARDEVEAAQQRADAAFLLADAATTTSEVQTLIRTAANGLNKITYSTAVPSGSGTRSGDTWFRINTANQITGQWQWTGSAWQAAPITNSLIASLDAGKISSGVIDAARIGADSITADKIAAGAVTADTIAANAVTAGKIAAGAVTGEKITAGSIQAAHLQITAGNLFPDPSFHDPCWGHFASSQYGHTNVLTLQGQGVQTGTYYQPSGKTNAALQLEPAASYRLSCWARFGGTNSIQAVSVYVRYLPADADTVSIVKVGQLPRTDACSYKEGHTECVITMPADMATGICTLGFFVERTVPDGAVSLSNMTLVRAADASLIVDGAVTARSIAADAVTASKIAAGAVTAGKIAAGAVTAGKIAAGAVTAGTIAADAVDAAAIKAGSVGASELLAEQATIDKLWTGGIYAKTVNTQKLLVTGANLVPNVHGWGSGDKTGWENFGLSKDDAAIWLQGETSQVSSARVTLEPGITYHFSVDVRSSVAGTVYYVALVALDLSGGVPLSVSSSGYLLQNKKVSAASVWEPASASFTVSEPCQARIRIWANHAKGAANTDGYQWFRNLSIRPMVGTTLIEGGAVTTGKIAANAVTAEKITVDQALINKLAVSSLWAGKITTQMLTAGDSYAGSVSVSQAGIKIKGSSLGSVTLTSAGLTAKASDGSTTVRIDQNGNASFKGSIAAGSTISAPVITGGTISGSTIIGGTLKTATRGRRLETTSYGTSFYDADGILTTTVDSDGLRFWTGGKKVGQIAENRLKNNDSVRGLSFGLEYENGYYMAFSHKESADAANFSMDFIVDPWGYANGNGTKTAPGIKFDLPIYCGGDPSDNYWQRLQFCLQTLNGRDEYPALMSISGRTGIAFGTNELYLIKNNTYYSLTDILGG